jgi:hypothetical protein
MLRWFKRAPRPVPGAWSTGPAPEGKVLIVAAYAVQLTGGDGRPIQYPPQIALAHKTGAAPWVNFLTGFNLGWAPDFWMVLRDLPDRAPASPFDHPTAAPGAPGL